MKESGRNPDDIKEGNLTFRQHKRIQERTLQANKLKAYDITASLEKIRADVAAGQSQYLDHMSKIDYLFEQLDQLQAFAKS